MLILYPYERLPSTSIAGETARNRLIEARQEGKMDLFSEFLDLSRFSEAGQHDNMAGYLNRKYAAVRPDMVIAFGSK